MKLNPKFALLWAALLGTALVAQAQKIFYTQDFKGGTPSGWTTKDASNQNVLWTWCNDPQAGQTATNGCSPLFDDGINRQKPFQSSTASNGFMTLNSDKPQNLPKNHISQLFSAPINCTGKKNVWIGFQSHLGVFTVPAETGAILRVSTDKVNWTDFDLFDGLTTTVRWSENPEESYLDISSVADNQATVYLQWQWTGNWEYFWNLDDVVLSEGSPAPRNNLVLSDFFYPASNYHTPLAAISKDTFGFYAYISNPGINNATNIKLKATVLDAAQKVLFTDEITIPALASGVVDSAFALSKTFAPELPAGKYTVAYSITSDSVDVRPLNNEGSSEFVVSSANYFAKEDGVQYFTRPATPSEWTVGNLYAIPANTKDKYKATQAEFAFAGDPDNSLAAKDVEGLVVFLRVKDNVPASFAGFETGDFPGESTESIGIGPYEAPDTLKDGQLQRVEILDLNTSSAGVDLEAGKRYFLGITYPPQAQYAQHAFNGKLVYTDVVSSFVYTDRWYLAGFGPDVTAVMRLYFDLTVTTDEKPLPSSALHVAPNPIHDALNLQVQFEQPTDATITIAEMSGRVIRYENRSGMLNETVRYDQLNLAPGTYLVRIATDFGTRTVKFSVVK